MNENELLEAFLNGFPESEHPLDRKRFIKFCLKSAQNQSAFPDEILRTHGVQEDRISHLESIHSWIRETYDYLQVKGMLRDLDL